MSGVVALLLGHDSKIEMAARRMITELAETILRWSCSSDACNSTLMRMTGVGQTPPSSFATATAELASIADVGEASAPSTGNCLNIIANKSVKCRRTKCRGLCGKGPCRL